MRRGRVLPESVTMLRQLVSVCLLAGLVSAYSGQFDKIDIDEILKNERLVTQYINCFKGVGKCTPDGAEVRDLIPDALKTNCGKCTGEQKDKTEKMIKFMLEKKRADFEELEKKYDPGCTYRESLREEISSRGIELGPCPS